MVGSGRLDLREGSNVKDRGKVEGQDGVPAWRGVGVLGVGGGVCNDLLMVALAWLGGIGMVFKRFF